MNRENPKFINPDQKAVILAEEIYQAVASFSQESSPEKKEAISSQIKKLTDESITLLEDQGYLGVLQDAKQDLENYFLRLFLKTQTENILETQLAGPDLDETQLEVKKLLSFLSEKNKGILLRKPRVEDYLERLHSPYDNLFDTFHYLLEVTLMNKFVSLRNTAYRIRGLNQE